ncbi:AQG_2a_G0022320.mRNA.1.CDS.1 [Saccharomyces cerevisiae]|jgi:protein PET54|uniref:Pet54p n=5 Tax=Saccharomyces TaxID=4930 RepID=C8Z9B4_YEAS8|nr:Pet54p [Saccharomyces cerevisiae YJM993]AJP38992.1 Pet54p [Saccharomyces cerevisiae YJM1078]AJR76312.1 Pet54p [Saccharomyces cerevisiae YJM189]AJR76810.1 Pet54p [Saccharomyces cerevisiae YJM193]AJR77810.1 Pet54p [Saccharomyces cerevisiae YJM244]AJR78313.1 Pet54p [Saccharomyces cerevisiae YJM248]AJR78796.1 Pet54p [Saccharomyces cerevisiae YJM270]AJR79294.1 Pet54p [Saccharomyces cerevisiae YJM271]AJR80251.1 Pet54p [Saccharomyces cerevisiae YJM326]AJR82249.1 Pet54p [Saccharomyces cerevisia
MKASSKAIKLVLDHLKSTGRVLGSVESGNSATISEKTASVNKQQQLQEKKPSVLQYRSYNPYLVKEDFLSILPENLYKKRGQFTNELDFQLMKVRDPKYFQFKDQYYLFFNDYNSLTEYIKLTKHSRINKIRVKMTPLAQPLPTLLTKLQRYSKNLYNAFRSSEQYFEGLNEKVDVSGEFTTNQLRSILDSVEEIENKSVLVWNIPTKLRSHDILNYFWFYNIRSSFKIYWDDEMKRNLRFISFENSHDAYRFKRNYHGLLAKELLILSEKGDAADYSLEMDDSKILIEHLSE